MQLINGKALAEKINDEIVKEIVALGQRPNLAIILVGENPDSELYVKKKIETGKLVGVEAHLYKCRADIGQSEVLEMIGFLNRDPLIDAIMVQLPLPKDQGYDTDKIIESIDPDKDLDRFHSQNIKTMNDNFSDDLILPPVFRVILKMLDSIKCEIKDKQITILANSDIFGRNLGNVLEFRGAKVSICRADDPDLIKKCSQSDILISILGKPKYVKKEMVKNGAVIIDVGITRDQGSTFGDVDFEDVKDVAGFISPVPGGVGPMTVAFTMRNALELYKKFHKQKI
jgi:methylenetetrahydrofolate dehydrogenase (NADP+) / methenyltetrahydrofolate cyclohydrolase